MRDTGNETQHSVNAINGGVGFRLCSTQPYFAAILSVWHGMKLIFFILRL